MVTGVFVRVINIPSSVVEDFISTLSPGTGTGPPPISFIIFCIQFQQMEKIFIIDVSLFSCLRRLKNNKQYNVLTMSDFDDSKKAGKSKR